MDRWYYMDGPCRVGPVAWDELRALAESGELLPSQTVRPESAHAWTPAGETEGLFPSPSPSRPIQLAYAGALSTHRAVKRAKAWCIAAFIFFCLGIPPTAGFAALFLNVASQRAPVPLPPPEPYVELLATCYFLLLIPAGIVAGHVVHWWSTIMTVPRGHKLLGLVGGLGIMAMLAIAFLAYILLSILRSM